MTVPSGAITYTCGVVFTSKSVPTTPSVSSNRAVGDAPRSFRKPLASSGMRNPCCPGPDEMTVNQTTPLPVHSFCILHVAGVVFDDAAELFSSTTNSR
jgi:hypothetical protein